MKQFADTSGDDSTLLLLKRVEKEDQLTRGDFEKAWIAFEDKAQAHEATSVEAIKHTGSQVHSQVSQTSKAALAQMEEIKKTSSDVLQHVELTRVRLEELEKFKRWVVDIGQLAAGVILVSGVVLGVVSLLSDPNQQTPSQMAETNAENSAKKAKTAETNAKASADKAAVVAGEAERALGIVGGFEEKFATQVTQVGVVLDQLETKSKQIDERLNSAEKLLQKGDEYSKKAEDAAARSEAEANKVTTEMKAEVKKDEDAAARAEAEARRRAELEAKRRAEAEARQKAQADREERDQIQRAMRNSRRTYAAEERGRADSSSPAAAVPSAPPMEQVMGSLRAAVSPSAPPMHHVMPDASAVDSLPMAVPGGANDGLDGWEGEPGGDRPTIHKCVICLDSPQTHLFVPCGHRAVCEECSLRFGPGKTDTCPMCPWSPMFSP